MASADFASVTFDLLTGRVGDAAERVHQSVHTLAGGQQTGLAVSFHQVSEDMAILLTEKKKERTERQFFWTHCT